MGNQMKVVAMGAGSIGSFLGGCLAVGKKADVALVGRDPHMSTVREKGLTVEFLDRTEVVQVEAFTHVEQVSQKPELVVLTVRAYQTDEALRQVVAELGTDVPVITFQNGNLLENISRAVGKRNTIGGTTLINAKLLEPGHVRQNVNYPVVVGELTGTNTIRIRKIRDAFKAGGLEAHISENVVGAIWAKMIINSTSNTLTGATNLTIRQLFASVPLRQYAYRMVRESFMVADLEGIDLDNISPGLAKIYKESSSSPEAWDAFAEGSQPDIKLSMCALLGQGAKTEVDYTNGYIAAKAVEHGTRAPHHEAVVQIIHEIEEGIRESSPDSLVGLEVS